jgi:hypothetical protein
MTQKTSGGSKPEIPGIKPDSQKGDDDLEQLFGSPLGDNHGGHESHDAQGDAGGVEFLSEDAAQPPQQIDSFESLEDFARDEFVKEEFVPEQSIAEEPAPENAAGNFANEEFPQQNFETTPDVSEAAPSGEFVATQEFPPFADQEMKSEASTSENQQPAEFVTTELPGTPEPTATKTPTLDSIKEYSESVSSTSVNVAASFPFTLRIDGHLTPQEAEKLIDVINRENMGFREVDLEPQLAEGKIMLPRISEYAGIVLIQALRGIQAKISFGASELFEGDTEETIETRPASIFSKSSDDFTLPASTSEYPVESPDALPITQGEDLPQLGVYQVSETLIVSGMLSTRSLESTTSPEYNSLLEALMRELKFKAFRRKARGITLLKIQVTPLTLPTDHRITVSGTLVI